MNNLTKNEMPEIDLFQYMESMKNNKSTGNDRLTTDFFKTFWDKLKTLFMKRISKKQAVIMLMEKKDWDKQYIKKHKNLLLNVDTKILSKTISNKLKTVLPVLISS